MSATFKCPSCGGPLDYDDSAALTVRCPFCSNSVIVPEELRSPWPAAAATPRPAPEPPAPPAPTPLTTPEAMRTQLKEARRAAREQRRDLRYKLREARRQR